MTVRFRSLLPLCLVLSIAPAAAQSLADDTPLAVQATQCHRNLRAAPAASLELADRLLQHPTLPGPVALAALSCKAMAQQTLGLGAAVDPTLDRLQRLATQPAMPAEDRRRALHMLVTVLQWRGQTGRALDVQQSLLDDAIAQQDVQAQIVSLLGIGMTRAQALRDPEGALHYFDRAISLSQLAQRKPHGGDALLYYNRGYALFLLGRHAQADAAFARAEQLSRLANGDALLRYRISSHRAELQRLQGQLDTAEARLTQVMAWQESNDVQGAMVTGQRLARIQLDRQQPDKALPFAEASLHAAEQARSDDEVRSGLELLADIHLALGDAQQARDYSQRVRAMDRDAVKGDTLERLAQLQARAERDVNPAQVRSQLDNSRDRLLRNAALAALALVLAGVAVWAVRSRRQQRRLRTLGSRDGLTGLPNRREAERHLQRAVIESAPGAELRCALLWVEVDGFKAFNDLHGQAMGDRALQGISRSLRMACDEGDLLARWNGPLFLLVRTQSTEAAAQALAAHLRTRVEQTPLDLPGARMTTLTVSIGVAPLPLFGIAPGSSDDSLRAADRALQTVRRSGHNGWASLWGAAEAGGVDLYSVLHNPDAAQRQGWLSLGGSRPMSWLPPRGDAPPPRAMGATGSGIAHG